MTKMSKILAALVVLTAASACSNRPSYEPASQMLDTSGFIWSTGSLR